MEELCNHFPVKWLVTSLDIRYHSRSCDSEVGFFPHGATAFPLTQSLTLLFIATLLVILLPPSYSKPVGDVPFFMTDRSPIRSAGLAPKRLLRSFKIILVLSIELIM